MAVGLGRVRRVVMIGSRARGTARAESDLDLVVPVETPTEERRWGAADFARERGRIQRVIGPPPVRADLSVRTTDRYEEARRVIGGVEYQVDAEGIDVYAEAFQRTPVVRSDAEQVRREHTYGWLQHAVDVLTQALRLNNARALRPVNTAPHPHEIEAARSAVKRAITSLLVWHRITPSTLHDDEGMLAQLANADPEIASQLRSILAQGPGSARVAHAVLGCAVARLNKDARMAPFLSRLTTPLVLLTS